MLYNVDIYLGGKLIRKKLLKLKLLCFSDAHGDKEARQEAEEEQGLRGPQLRQVGDTCSLPPGACHVHQLQQLDGGIGLRERSDAPGLRQGLRL